MKLGGGTANGMRALGYQVLPPESNSDSTCWRMVAPQDRNTEYLAADQAEGWRKAERHWHARNLENVVRRTPPTPATEEREAVECGAVSDDAVKHLEIRSQMNRIIYRAIRQYRMSNMTDDDGYPYPLVDLMSNPAPADIGTGEMEMVALADDIEEALAQIRAAEEKAAYDRGVKDMMDFVRKIGDISFATEK